MSNSVAHILNHASERMQQRVIPSAMVPIVEEYGTYYRVRDGAESVQISRKNIKKLWRELKQALSHLDTLADTYLVIKDSCPITGAHGYKRRKQQ